MIFLVAGLAVLLGAFVGAGMFFLMRFLKLREKKPIIISGACWLVVVALIVGINLLVPYLAK